MEKKAYSPAERAILKKMKFRWPAAYTRLSENLHEAVASNSSHGPCPSPNHRASSDAFRFFDNWEETGGGVCNSCGAFSDGAKLLTWLLEKERSEVFELLGNYLKEFPDAEADKGVVVADVATKKKKDPRKAESDMRIAWQDSLPIIGTAGELYLNNRGIWSENIPSALRFHPSMKYWDTTDRTKPPIFCGEFPVILAPLKDIRGKVMGIHRIFITKDGQKAPVPDAKKPMPVPVSISGCAIKLFNPVEGVDTELGVGEGIETMLGVRAISKMPVWSCYSARVLSTVQIPKFIKKVVIWGDKDRTFTGHKITTELAHRLIAEGFEVEAYFPKETIAEGMKGVDWLDVLTGRGIEGFPPKYRRWVESESGLLTPT